MMEYVVLGGDERFVRLAHLLRRRGREAIWLDGREDGSRALAGARVVVSPCPRGGKQGPANQKALLDLVGEGAKLVLCGPGHPEGAPEGVVDLWRDEALLVENAALTAEAAVACAMKSSSTALRGMRCAVIGWGRIGRALTELLVALGARVTVASRAPESRRRAIERGAEAVPTGMIAGALGDCGLVLNTAPAMVLDERTLAAVDREAMLIDLASPPYGINLTAAWKRGLRAWREPGLPGRFYPQSAALALLHSMERFGVLERGRARG